MLSCMIVVDAADEDSAVLWLQHKQLQCINKQLVSYKQSLAHYYHCVYDHTLQCNLDVADYNNVPVELHYFCGTISILDINRRLNMAWIIHSSANLRIYFQEFSLHHEDWICAEEVLTIIRKRDSVQFCGKRLPWQQDFHGADLSITFVTNIKNSQASFHLSYHTMFSQISKIAFIYSLNYEHLLTASKEHYHELGYTELIHILSEVKLDKIHTFLHNLSDAGVKVFCYDGPSDKSPRIYHNESVNSEIYLKSTSFAMYCVVTRINVKYVNDSQIYLTFSTFREELKVYGISTLPVEVSSDALSFFIDIDSTITDNVIYILEINQNAHFKNYFLSMDSAVVLELTLHQFEGFLPHLLMEGTSCSYGGLYIYRRLESFIYGNIKYNQQMYQCTKDQYKNMPIYLELTSTTILVSAFAGYIDGRIKVHGQIAVKTNHQIMIDMKFASYYFSAVNSTVKYYLHVGFIKDSRTFLLQPIHNGRYLMSNFHFEFTKYLSPKLMHVKTFPTIIISFKQNKQNKQCAQCYITFPDNSHFIKFYTGRKEISPIRNSYITGQVEANVESVIVDQSKCQQQQIWTLTISEFTNDEIQPHGNRSKYILVYYDYETIWRYVEASDDYIWYLLVLSKLEKTGSDVVMEIKLDLTCFTSDVYVEHILNTTDNTDLLLSSILYKWHNTTQSIWISGFEQVNVILVSDAEKIPSSCSKRGLEVFHVKYRYPFSETIKESSGYLLRPRIYQFYHLR